MLEEKQLLAEYTDHDASEVLNSWLHGNGLISSLYSNVADRLRDCVDYYDFKGHEFFVLAGKSGRPPRKGSNSAT